MISLSVFKWWWGWNSEKVEVWLEKMEEKGFVLDRVTWFGIRFHFIEAEGKRVRCCIDYQPRLDKEYLNLIHDDGWELIPMGAGWYVCRKQYDDQRPDLYTDYNSLITRNKKLMAILMAGIIPTIVGWPIVIRENNFSMLLFWGLISIFYLFGLFKLKDSTDILKKKKELQNS